MSTTGTDMNQHWLKILQHSLGLNKHGIGRRYRNHYCAGPGHHSYDECVALAALGLMVDHGNKSPLFGGAHCFTVTAAGDDYIREHSPAEPARTRSQERYRQYLATGDGMSFILWLRSR